MCRDLKQPHVYFSGKRCHNEKEETDTVGFLVNCELENWNHRRKRKRKVFSGSTAKVEEEAEPSVGKPGWQSKVQEEGTRQRFGKKEMNE